MTQLSGLAQHPNLTPAEVAVFLGISRTKVYDMLQQGLLPRLKVGDHWRIPREKFCAWYEIQQQHLAESV